MKRIYDCIIIGGGVCGSAAARFLSAFKGDFALLERSEDVCTGTTKANSAIVHSGFDAPTGSNKAKFNLLGNLMMKELSRELDFPFIENGSMVICTKEENLYRLQELYDRGIQNGVKGLKILTAEEALNREPNLTRNVKGALFAETGGIVCPFGLNIGLAENAADNGVEFHFNTAVKYIKKSDLGWNIETDRGEFHSRAVINAAGVYADEIHNMVSESKLNIVPRKGEYCLLDKTTGKHVRSTIFSLPTKMGKGVLVTPTVHGNLLLGPTSMEIDDKENLSTTDEGLETVREKASTSVENINMSKVITSFAGLRAHEEGGDFIVGEVSDARGFFDCAGIESPGLTSAPAIGKYLSEKVASYLGLDENPNYNPIRKGIVNPKKLSKEQYEKLIEKEPAYGRIICRCQQITEGEIIDSIKRTLGADTLDGVKRRTTSQMGRCQGGFCMPKITEIISRERGVPLEAVRKNGKMSALIVGRDKML